MISGGGNGGVLVGLGYTFGASLFLVGMNWPALSVMLGSLAPISLIFFTYFIIAVALMVAIEIATSDDPKAALKLFGLGVGMGIASCSMANEGLLKANIPGFIIRMLTTILVGYIGRL